LGPFTAQGLVFVNWQLSELSFFYYPVKVNSLLN
jgi:hypothetical protein